MSRLGGLLGALRGRGVGFAIDETMAGYHEFEPGFGPDGRYPMAFSARWGPRDLAAFLDPLGEAFQRAPLSGTVTVGGLCEAAPVTGTLAFSYVRGRSIRYTFDFDVDGTAYTYVGEKVNIRPWNLLTSHTTCFGTVTEAATGRLVSRSVTHFAFRTGPRFLASLRLTRGAA
jgi:hypothetical protein